MSEWEKRRMFGYAAYLGTLVVLWAFVVWKASTTGEWKWWGHAVALLSIAAIEAVQVASRDVFRPVHLVVTVARMGILTIGVTLAAAVGGTFGWMHLGHTFNVWLLVVLLLAGGALGLWAGVSCFSARDEERQTGATGSSGVRGDNNAG